MCSHLPIPIFTFLYDRFRALESGDTYTILWKLTSLRLLFDTAKSFTRLDDVANNPSTLSNSTVYRAHAHGYNFLSGSTHMIWTLPQQISPQLCLTCSTATKMVY